MFVTRQQKKPDKSWRSGANRSRSYMTDVRLLCMLWANLKVLAGSQKPSNDCCVITLMCHFLLHRFTSDKTIIILSTPDEVLSLQLQYINAGYLLWLL